MTSRWKAISQSAAVFTSGVVVLVALIWLFSTQHWVLILDDANLVFHEAGHPIIGLLGPTPYLYGGTLGQLVFPSVCAYSFWQQRQPGSFALCFAWFFENFLNIGRYMSDARAQVLPLVGGGEHDWTAIFTRWGILPYDTVVGHLTIALGLLGMLGCAAWLLRQARQMLPSRP